MQLKFRPIDYLPRHPNLKKVRRAKIIDWFVRCQEDFEVNHEVLYQSVKTFDLYLGITENMDEFEYIGAAAMIIAAKTDVRFLKFFLLLLVSVLRALSSLMLYEKWSQSSVM